MKINRLFSIAAATMMMVACSSEDTALKNTPAAGPQMQFTATIAAPGSGTTRTAYTESGTDINVTWSVDDEIALVHDGVKDVATVKTINADGSATITGFITKANNGDDVQLYYPAARMISNGQGGFTFDPVIEGKKLTQDGTLKYIQDNLDFREGEGQLSVNGTEVTLKEPVKMAAENAIWKLTLKDETPADLNATQVKVKAAGVVQASTAALSTAVSTVYLAVPAMDEQAIDIVATVGENTYAYSKEGVTLGAKYYQSTVAFGKPVATVTTAPTASSETIYPQSTKALVNAGVAKNGTMMYRLTTSNTKPETAGDFSEDVPTAAGILNAGTYYVWYYAKGDDTHADSDIAGSVSVTIETAVPSESFTTTNNTIVSGKVFEGTHFTVTASRNTGSNGINIAYLYSNQSSLTIAAKNGETITKVEFTCGEGKDQASLTSVTSGTINWSNGQTNGSIGNVNAHSVTMTNSYTAGWVAISSVKVYYTE